jgi:hypothetical protein
MRIINPVLPDPTDVYLAGWNPLGEIIPATFPTEWKNAQETLQQTDIVTLPEVSVWPEANPWIPYWGSPTSIGPMAMQGGIVAMVPLGPKAPPTRLVQPEEIALYSALPRDLIGLFFPPLDETKVNGEPPFSFDLPNASPANAFVPPTLIRQELVLSGSLKITTMPMLPLEFGQKIYEVLQSGQQFLMTGVTVDRNGTPLGNCRVIAYQSSWRAVPDLPVVIAETISDGSGNFSMLLRNIAYQLTAYLPGSPDRAGITSENVTPVVATNIYLRDPTAADPASGAGMIVHPGMTGGMRG